MTVSKIASRIYQAAKAKAKGVWSYRAEWSKAMKAAWRKVARKAAWNLQEAKRIAIAAARSAQIKINIEKVAASVAADTRTVEQKLAEGAWKMRFAA